MNKKYVFKKSVDDFSFIATKLTNKKENLEKLLGSQRQSLSNLGLGYNPFFNQKDFQKNLCETRIFKR